MVKARRFRGQSMSVKGQTSLMMCSNCKEISNFKYLKVISICFWKMTLINHSISSNDWWVISSLWGVKGFQSQSLTRLSSPVKAFLMEILASFQRFQVLGTWPLVADLTVYTRPLLASLQGETWFNLDILRKAGTQIIMHLLNPKKILPNRILICSVKLQLGL
jgi:hypothetical protein